MLPHWDLSIQLEEFILKFDNEGPGTVTDMDKGLKLMEEYQEEFIKLESTRTEMGKYKN